MRPPAVDPAARRRARSAVPLALALLAAPAAAAPPSVTLDPAVVDRCPSADAIARRWRARRPDPDARVELTIRADGDRLIGLVRAALPREPPAARRLGARRDGCDPLVDALLTAAALLTAPIALPPEPQPPAPPPEPDPPPPPAELRLALGPRLDTGATPAAAYLGELHLTRWTGPLGLGGGLHIGAMPAAPVGAARAAIERYAAQLHGCWRPGAIGLCALARAGALAVRPAGTDGDDTLQATADLGARAAWSALRGPRWALVLDLEAAVPLRPLRLALDGAPAWSAWPVALGAGLTAEWAL